MVDPAIILASRAFGNGFFSGFPRFFERILVVCERVLQDAGLETQLHANGTNIEGKWDTVFAAIKRCHEVVHEMGAPRISTVIKVGTRTDRAQTMDDKIRSVRSKLGET